MASEDYYFPQKSVQAVLETTVVLNTKDITYTLMKFAVKKGFIFQKPAMTDPTRHNLAARNPTGFYGP